MRHWRNVVCLGMALGIGGLPAWGERIDRPTDRTTGRGSLLSDKAFVSPTEAAPSRVVRPREVVRGGPPSPTGLTATPGDSAVTLAWKALGDATGYDVYRSATNGDDFVRLNAAPLVTSRFSDTGLSNFTTYYYKVARAGALSFSETIAVAPPGPASHFFILAPSIGRTDTSSSAGTALNYYYNTGDGPGSFVLQTSYTRIRPRAGTDRNFYSGEADIQLNANRDWAQITFGVGYSEAQGASHDTTLILAASKILNAWEIDPTLTYDKSTSVGGGGVNGFQPDIDVAYTLNPTAKIDFDYTVNNVVDGESTYVGTVKFTLDKARTSYLKISAGKHGRLRATFLYRF